MRTTFSIVLLVVVGCSSGSAPTQGPPGPPEPPKGPPTDAGPLPPPETVAPDAAPLASTQCNADSRHCCMADGTLVVPGGCQPSYPDNVQPATDRGADGYCVRIECHKKCLPATARIATPSGDVVVTELGIGDVVWSVDERGEKIEAKIRAIGPQDVVGRHEVVEISLSDGRSVRASAEHPLADGGTVGELVKGAALDGATVRAVRTVPYDGAQTWDLRPEGATGAYWADGVLLGTTIAAP